MSFQTHLDNLKKLNLPEGEFVVVSSGALAVRGIREARDLDVVVMPELFAKLSNKYPVVEEGGMKRIKFEDSEIEMLDPEHSLFGNSSVIPLADIFEQADIFQGIKFMNLEQLRKLKQVMNREKDLRDIALIDEYLKK